MKKSRAYRSKSVKQVRVSEFTEGRGSSGVHVGLDVSKETIHAVSRWGANDFSRPWKVENPSEIREFVNLLAELGRGRPMVVSLEPTGTYGDPFRQCMADAGLPVYRVSPKASHDYAEIFDGVPSQHDGKDAAIVAELASMGKCWQWSFGKQEWERELSHSVNWMESQRRMSMTWYGQLEGLLARHWPEATRTLSLRSTVLLRTLVEYGGPLGLAEAADAKEQLWRWGRGKLTRDKIDRFVTEARHSVGVREGEVMERRLRGHAEQALACRRAIEQSRRELKALCGAHEVIEAQGKIVGVTTACVLWAHLGDPRCYDSAQAYRKAMGLNLVERSSGKWEGKVHISKRGPREVRRWLYLSAIRLLRDAQIRQWYDAKLPTGPEGSRAMRLIVALMRKLSLVLHRAAKGQPYKPGLLFPGDNISSIT